MKHLAHSTCLINSSYYYHDEFGSVCAQLCLIYFNPMDCSPLAPLSMGILQAIILEWVAISFSRGSSPLRDWTCVSCVCYIDRPGRFFTTEPPGKPVIMMKVKVKVTQSCPTLWDPMDYTCDSPWDSPAQNTGVDSLSLLQGIFPIQGSNPCLPHCRQILYQLSHKGSPIMILGAKKKLCAFSYWIYSELWGPGTWFPLTLEYAYSESIKYYC